jgi:hypothetical protein
VLFAVCGGLREVCCGGPCGCSTVPCVPPGLCCRWPVAVCCGCASLAVSCDPCVAGGGEQSHWC